jgi:hypothetical protein
MLHVKEEDDEVDERRNRRMKKKRERVKDKDEEDEHWRRQRIEILDWEEKGKDREKNIFGELALCKVMGKGESQIGVYPPNPLGVSITRTLAVKHCTRHEDLGLIQGWSVQWDETHQRTKFWNSETGDSQWNTPL